MTRIKSGATKVCSERPCVICNFVKKRNISERFRIGSKSRAWHFLAAINFNKDDVYQRCVFCKQPGDVFAADVLYHSNCLSAYLLKFDRELEKVNEYCVNASSGDTDSDELSKAVNDLCSQLNLDTHGYALSECRDQINASLTRPGRDIYINNRRLTNLLIE